MEGFVLMPDAQLLQVFAPIYQRFGVEATYRLYQGVGPDDDGAQEDKFREFPVTLLVGKTKRWTKPATKDIFIQILDQGAHFRVTDLPPDVTFDLLTSNDRLQKGSEESRITDQRNVGPFVRLSLKGGG